MDQINLYGKVKSGKIEFGNKEVLNQWIRTLNEGDHIVAKFNISRNYKSTRQLRLLYHCFRELSSKLGYEVEEIKVMMKLKAGLCFSHNIEGQDVTVCKSISDFTKVQLSEFVEFIDKWSSESLNFPLLTYEDIKFLKDDQN